MKKATLGILGLLMVGVLAVGAFAVPWRGSNGMQEALAAGDYDAYLDAFEDNDRPFMQNKLSEEEFNERVEQYQEMAQHREEREQIREQIQAAIEAGDYDTWYELVTTNAPPRIEDVVTADNFDTFAEMHKARQDGDHEKAQELAQELGIEGLGPGMGHGHGCGGPGNGLGR